MGMQMSKQYAIPVCSGINLIASLLKYASSREKRWKEERLAV